MRIRVMTIFTCLMLCSAATSEVPETESGEDLWLETQVTLPALVASGYRVVGFWAGDSTKMAPHLEPIVDLFGSVFVLQRPDKTEIWSCSSHTATYKHGDPSRVIRNCKKLRAARRLELQALRDFEESQ